MNIVTLPNTDDEQVADQIVKRAASLEREGGGAPASFLKQMFAHAAPEDLVGYQPAELASSPPAPTNSFPRAGRASRTFAFTIPTRRATASASNRFR